MIAVDTNVLVYAFVPHSRFHDQAVTELESLATGAVPWGLPVFAIGEFLRVVTHSGYLSPPADISAAVANIDDLLRSSTAELLVPDMRFWPVMRDVLADARVSGNNVFDAQIVAVCLEHGVDTILTEDRDFRRFTSIRVQHLDG